MQVTLVLLTLHAHYIVIRIVLQCAAVNGPSGPPAAHAKCQNSCFFAGFLGKMGRYGVHRHPGV